MKTLCFLAIFFAVFCEAANGSNSIDNTLKTFEAISQKDPELATTIATTRHSIAIVFVPGILGSKLTAPSGNAIFGDLNDFSTVIQRLALPPNLIDENVDSGITAEVLLELAGQDVYRTAMDKMKGWTRDHQISFKACGYDWRRDIRSGSKELDRCLNSLPPGITDIVLIAHSMGGLVTWNWEQQYKNNNPRKLNVVLTVILGSPLRGSCEIIRMIESGYIQPTPQDRYARDPSISFFSNEKERLVGALENYVTGSLTDGIRPLLLTWPGAIEMSPPRVDDPTHTECIGITRNNGQLSTSYYDMDFWRSPAGMDMLRRGRGASYPIPNSAADVLAKANEFRSNFKAKKLRSPAWLYSSQFWLVPDHAIFDPTSDTISEVDKWGTQNGDGRVPYDSATNFTGDKIFSYQQGVGSIHGDLATDADFLKDFFGISSNNINSPNTSAGRLQNVLDAWLARRLIGQSILHEEWIQSYAKISNVAPDTGELHSIFEPWANVQLSESIGSYEDDVGNFRKKLCEIRQDCPTSYSSAKVISQSSGFRAKARSNSFEILNKVGKAPITDRLWAEGNKGLLQAKNLQWVAATATLKSAQDKTSDAISSAVSTKEADQFKQFGVVLEANLAKSLYQSGQCKEAELHLLATTGYWGFSKDALAKPCKDAPSGLLYCFDRKDFCPAH